VLEPQIYWAGLRSYINETSSRDPSATAFLTTQASLHIELQVPGAAGNRQKPWISKTAWA
jgi:hypothetical protein